MRRLNTLARGWMTLLPGLGRRRNRRGARAGVLVLLAALGPAAAARASAERQGTVVFSLHLDSPARARDVKLWFPYPTSDSFQSIEDLEFSGNYTRFTLSREPNSGALDLFTRRQGPAKKRTLSVSFKVRTRARPVETFVETGDSIPIEVDKYVHSDCYIPSNDSGIRRLAGEITAGDDERTCGKEKRNRPRISRGISRRNATLA